MFEYARSRLGVGKGTMRTQFPVGHDNELARFDAADIFCSDQVQCDGFGSEDIGFADPSHHQGPDAQRIAAGNHAFGGHADQRIGAFDLFQRVDELVEQCAIFGCRKQMDDDFGIAGRLENGTLPYQIVAQGQGVGNIAIMGDGKAAGRKIGFERLYIAQRTRARGRIADMAAGGIPAQAVDHFLAVEIAGYRTQGAMAVEFAAVAAGNARRFLSAMLQRVQAQRHHGGSVLNAGDTKNAALFP